MNANSDNLKPIAVVLFIFGLLNQPFIQSQLHSTMLTHTLILIVGQLVLGWLLAILAAPHLQEIKWPKINSMGVNSWLYVSFSLVFWMLPAVMDMVVESSLMQWIRNINLLTAGCALQISLRHGHQFLSLFFSWNLLTMIFIQGLIYLTLPERVCNVYLLGDQEQTAESMILLSAVLGICVATKSYREVSSK